MPMLRALARYLAAFPLTLLDVLAAESAPAAPQGASPSNPAPAGATPTHNGPITACPICGEPLICRIAAEQEMENPTW